MTTTLRSEIGDHLAIGEGVSSVVEVSDFLAVHLDRVFVLESLAGRAGRPGRIGVSGEAGLFVLLRDHLSAALTKAVVLQLLS